MWRDDRYKYNHYVNQPPQLFDLQNDPDELNDLAADASHAETLSRCEAGLREILDPEAMDTLAKSDQRALVEKHGGAEAVLARGTFTNSPVPGEKPSFITGQSS